MGGEEKREPVMGSAEKDSSLEPAAGGTGVGGSPGVASGKWLSSTFLSEQRRAVGGAHLGAQRQPKKLCVWEVYLICAYYLNAGHIKTPIGVNSPKGESWPHSQSLPTLEVLSVPRSIWNAVLKVPDPSSTPAPVSASAKRGARLAGPRSGQAWQPLRGPGAVWQVEVERGIMAIRRQPI